MLITKATWMPPAHRLIHSAAVKSCAINRESTKIGAYWIFFSFHSTFHLSVCTLFHVAFSALIPNKQALTSKWMFASCPFGSIQRCLCHQRCLHFNLVLYLYNSLNKNHFSFDSCFFFSFCFLNILKYLLRLSATNGSKRLRQHSHCLWLCHNVTSNWLRFGSMKKLSASKSTTWLCIRL